MVADAQLYSSLALLLPFVRSGVARGAFDVSRQPGQTGREVELQPQRISFHKISQRKVAPRWKHPLLQRGVFVNYPDIY